MRLSKLAYLYAGWLRDNPAREILAALGILVGVALVFATVTANQSVYGASSRIIDSVAGAAQLKATTSSQAGVPQRSVPRRPQGVRSSAVTLEEPLAIAHGHWAVSTQIIGVGPRLISLNRSIARVPFRSSGLILPSALAAALHLEAGDTVTVFARGEAQRARVEEVLGAESIGALAHSLVAFAYLPFAQRLLGLPGRISTVWAHVATGQTQLARAALVQALGPGATVSDAHAERGMLREALRPQDQSTSFFVLLAALVGVLLVGTATMLSASERRRELAELWLQGYGRPQLISIVAFQGFVLGAGASALGVLAGYGLARSFGHQPDYLASAFPLASQTVISPMVALVVWMAGVLVTCACVGTALLALRNPTAAYHNRGAAGRTIRPSTKRWTFAGALLLLATTFALSATSNALIPALLLAVVVLLLVPAAVAGVGRLAGAPMRSRRLKTLVVAAGSVRAWELQAVTLAATAAIGLFGAVVAVDVHGDLLRGLESGYARYVASADVWVSSPGDNLATSAFPTRGLPARIKTVPGVTDVRLYYGGWLDMHGRRLWLIARSSTNVIPPTAIIRGSPVVAERRLHEHGWFAVSDELARSLNLTVGDAISLPTATGIQTLRMAATTTNLGWSSGLVFLSAGDYLRYWGRSAEPTALEINASPGTSVAAISRAVGLGLDVQTAARRAAVADALPQQGLVQLAEIAWLLVATAAVAVAVAMAALIWQRRAELASLRLQSLKPGQLQSVLAWEATIVVGAGALLGGAIAVYGHLLADRYLRVATGYPVAQATDVPQVFAVVALVAAVTALILAAPGYLAARAPLRLALDGR